MGVYSAITILALPLITLVDAVFEQTGLRSNRPLNDELLDRPQFYANRLFLFTVITLFFLEILLMPERYITTLIQFFDLGVFCICFFVFCGYFLIFFYLLFSILDQRFTRRKISPVGPRG